MKKESAQPVFLHGVKGKATCWRRTVTCCGQPVSEYGGVITSDMLEFSKKK
jgi:hypothetical protein